MKPSELISTGEKTSKVGINTQTALLSVIALIMACTVLNVCKSVVIPLIFAFLLSYLVSPILTFLKKLKVPAPLGVLIIILLLLGATYLFGAFMYQRVYAFVEESPKYQESFMEISKSVTSRWKIDTSSLDEINWTKEITPRVMSITGSFVDFMSKSALVMFFLIFMLLEQGGLKRRLSSALDKKQAGKISDAVTAITNQIGRYLKIKMMVSVVTGTLVWLVLALIGVDFAITWGVLAFFLNFIPNIGSILSTIPPIFVAFVENYPRPLPVILAAIGLLLIQICMGSIIEPKMQGKGLNLSPVVILFSLVFWGWLWGIPGMLLSVPITSSIKIACENIEALKPVAVFMGGSEE
ncbi:MAG: AI-2E family transporter [Kiritimatiellae bacterium]|jgi:AI-2 transport protein TqsA|nr:AI-2E family transporter [Kiritimatiellia bacterium]